MIETFATLLDAAILDVPGVPVPIAVAELRKAAIDFCERSGAWTVEHDPISSIAGQGEYEFELDSGVMFVGVVQAWYRGREIFYRTPTQLQELTASGKWNEHTGGDALYFTLVRDIIAIYPKPESTVANAIAMTVSVAPSRTAIGMEKWVVDRYWETLSHGAKYRMYVKPGSQWTNNDLATYHLKNFIAGIEDASVFMQQNTVLPALVAGPPPI